MFFAWPVPVENKEIIKIRYLYIRQKTQTNILVYTKKKIPHIIYIWKACFINFLSMSKPTMVSVYEYASLKYFQICTKKSPTFFFEIRTNRKVIRTYGIYGII